MGRPGMVGELVLLQEEEDAEWGVAGGGENVDGSGIDSKVDDRLVIGFGNGLPDPSIPGVLGNPLPCSFVELPCAPAGERGGWAKFPNRPRTG